VSWARRETAGTRARRSRGIIRRLWRLGRASARVAAYASGQEGVRGRRGGRV
jgi:hypothetical protein